MKKIDKHEEKSYTSNIKQDFHVIVIATKVLEKKNEAFDKQLIS